MSQYINVTKLDDNQIREKFDEAFRAAGEDRDNELRINEIDVDVVRDAARGVKVHVSVYGLAEVTTQEQFCDPKTKKVVKGAQSIKFDVDGRGTAAFAFESVERKNSNDYVVVYKPL